MNLLERYFLEEFEEDYTQLTAIRKTIQKTLKTFIKTHNDKNNTWPYEICRNSEIDYPSAYSISTHGMILSMLAYSTGELRNRKLYTAKKVPDTDIFKDAKGDCADIKKMLHTGKLHFIEELLASPTDTTPEVHTFSKTYGTNDPMSLLWAQYICETCTSHKSIHAEELLNSAANNFLQKIESNNDYLDITLIQENSNKITQYQHPFLALRTLQFIKERIKNEENSGEISSLFKFFETNIHQHISYFDIPDARFDPAELTFSTEGALLTCGEYSISEETIERALNIIEKAQALTPSLRPVNPIYTAKRGQILLPLSIEVANSALRILAILEDSEETKPLAAKHIGIFKRYFKWIKAQQQEFTTLKDGERLTCCGWSSEHTGSKTAIHLWQTAEILTFCIGYYDLLQRSIAHKSLKAAGLKTVKPSTRSNTPPLEEWDNIAATYEPFKEFDRKDQIFAIIKEHFIEPRIAKSTIPAKFSLLLYGPPGTGKTTIAKAISKTLGWKLITVSPSDFLAGGAIEVEARAKFIFKCLEEQKDTVILFDEIDHFLLDRESDEYKNQTGIFQFMTPGMLTKINDLRERENNIFIIATNYYERIDPAIKRIGRIDICTPLMPPALKARYMIITNKLKENKVDIENEKVVTYTKLLAKNSTLCTYNDIKAHFETIVNLAKNEVEASPYGAAGKVKFSPSITTKAYEYRFETVTQNGKSIKHISKTPFDEYTKLILIEKQAPNFDAFELRTLTGDATKYIFHKHTEELADKDYATPLVERNLTALR